MAPTHLHLHEVGLLVVARRAHVGGLVHVLPGLVPTHDVVRLLPGGGDLHLVLLSDRVLVRAHGAQKLDLDRALLDLRRAVVTGLAGCASPDIGMAGATEGRARRGRGRWLARRVEGLTMSKEPSHGQNHIFAELPRQRRGFGFARSSPPPLAVVACATSSSRPG